jgi:hypothetical protein
VLPTRFLRSRVYTTKRNQHGVATSTATVNSGLSPEALAGLPSAMTMNKGLKRNVKESDSSVVWHKQDKKLAEQSMIAPLLPQDIRFGASVRLRPVQSPVNWCGLRECFASLKARS